MAAVACPVGAIGGAGRAEMREGTGAFPQLIADNVYHCGYYSAGSYGSASYLVVRPEGNLLIDSPCFARQLVRRIEELGGVATMFLSHRDDVADHQKFQRHFGCERIMHAADIGHGTWDVEVPIEGFEPVSLDQDGLLIPVPGHTRGSMCFLYRDKFLFSGDHCGLIPEDRAMRVSRHVCWYDWGEQCRSMARLATYRFEWCLPGHWPPARLPPRQLQQALGDWLAREFIAA